MSAPGGRSFSARLREQPEAAPVIEAVLREYLMERRRALYLELDHIEKALDLPRKGK